MNITGYALTSALLLGAFWPGSAAAGPLPSNPRNSAALFASVMQNPPLIDESDSFELAPNLQRQIVSYATAAATGTIIIDTAHTYLYFILGGGKAIRYGIGVGRDGFTWSGAQTVTRMAEWPDWTPP